LEVLLQVVQEQLTEVVEVVLLKVIMVVLILQQVETADLV
jgi:hypothetical protein